ncbi:hypothetical protein RvY_16569 [Ramazzottius varieornatus]|uniref:Uncharacterized protein n=1 Tax=Ramazzottius varieornatus TaxID=947166 RepID=A0A1D1VYY0_RAMVA|nr:hypothetical protein RvY_16569 [Ramazzottius varieornatus]
MLGDIEHGIPDVDPLFRDPHEIELLKKFYDKHSSSFTRRAACAVNILAAARPHDPISPFVEVFRPKAQQEVTRQVEANPFYFAPLESELKDITIQSGIHLAGKFSLDIVFDLTSELPQVFRIGTFFHLIRDGVTKTDVPPDDHAFRETVFNKTLIFVKEWQENFRGTRNSLCALRDFLEMDHNLTEYFDQKTIIPEPPPKPYDLSGKKIKDKHPFFKLPWPPKKKPIQRIKYNTVEDGYVGIALVSFSAVVLVAKQLNLPLRRFIRVVAAAVLPDMEWPVKIPMPMLTVFTNPKVSSGKLRILSEVMVTPNGPWEPAESMDSRGSASWGLERIVDAFGPLQKLMDDQKFNAGFAVTLNTTELVSKGQYDVKGKAKPPESVLKIVSALFRKYRGMVAILNPLNAEHRDKLKPFCEKWAKRLRQPYLFHENFAVFNETLAGFPACFRGALISIKGEDTVRDIILRMAEAQSLELPVCLQNSTGLTFADSSILLEIGVGLGVDYVKLDAPGRPEIFSAAEKYLNITEAHSNRQPKSFSTTVKELRDSMPKIYSGFPVYTVNPSASYVQEKRENYR